MPKKSKKPAEQAPAPSDLLAELTELNNKRTGFGPPLVSCVMLVDGLVRERFTRMAFQCFADQIYPHKELVIVNSGKDAVSAKLMSGVKNPPKPASVREINIVGRNGRLGLLRNVGLDMAKGEWICQWDDDDWHHPQRIAYQMACRRGADDCVLLRNEVRVDLTRGVLRKAAWPGGHSHTALYPKRADRRYRDLGTHDSKPFYEDGVYILDHHRTDTIVAGNPASLYIKMVHGSNVVGEAGHGPPTMEAVKPEDRLSQAQLELVADALGPQGARILDLQL